MFSVLSGHSVQPLTDSKNKMMEDLCTRLPTVENHLLDLWSDLENRLRPLLRPLSPILNPANARLPAASFGSEKKASALCQLSTFTKFVKNIKLYN